MFYKNLFTMLSVVFLREKKNVYLGHLDSPASEILIDGGRYKNYFRTRLSFHISFY